MPKANLLPHIPREKSAKIRFWAGQFKIKEQASFCGFSEYYIYIFNRSNGIEGDLHVNRPALGISIGRSLKAYGEVSFRDEVRLWE